MILKIYFFVFIPKRHDSSVPCTSKHLSPLNSKPRIFKSHRFIYRWLLNFLSDLNVSLSRASFPIATKKLSPLGILLFSILSVAENPAGKKAVHPAEIKPAPLSDPIIYPEGRWPSWFLSKDQNPQKWAVLPTYSHNSTYGHIGGGRFFIYPSGNTGYYTSLETLISQELFFETHWNYQYWKKNGDQFAFTALYNGFSEPYYGEGPDTKPEDRKDLHRDKIHISAEYIYRIKSKLYGGAFFGFDYRKENTPNPIHEREQVFSMGLLVRYDSRDNYFNASQGEYYQLKFWTLFPSPNPVFVEGSAQLFFPLYKKHWILAGKVSAGVSLLHFAPYLFRFALGGPKQLRGYRQNRFRGEKYYLSQTELRYTPWPFLTTAVFFDVGSAGDTWPLPPRYAFGGGLRFGLPPDYNKKIRVEVGFGQDQYNVIVNFGHPF